MSPSKAEKEDKAKVSEKGSAGHKHSHRIDKNGKVHHDHPHAQPAKRAKV
jgi:hypothetical protein